MVHNPFRLHILQHAPQEGPGMIEPWMQDRGVRVSKTCLWETQFQFPDPQEIDGVLILGGAMGVYETERYPWLTQEITWLQRVIATSKPLLGICLGSQLLAAALGARVYPTGFKEIGWYPIHWTSEPPVGLPWKVDETLPVFHWHGDTFDLPSGARLLASSNRTPHQAFVWNSVLGLQFHIEVDKALAQAFLDTGSEEVESSAGVQSPREILELASYSQETQPVLRILLDRWFLQETKHP